MTKDQIVTTDEILVEFAGDLREVVVQLSRLLRGFAHNYPFADDPWWDTSQAILEYQRLIERLNDNAPHGYFFGGHPLQPQCLGYWPNQEF